MDQLCDVFPSKLLKSVDEFHKLSKFENIDELFKDHGTPFIPHIPMGKKKLYYKQMDMTHLIMQNIERTVLDSRIFRQCEPYKWTKIDQKLRLPVKSSNVEKKYTDTRTSFRWRNVFLTKSYFTFGLRKTDKDQLHIYQTTEAPIIYYELCSTPHNSEMMERTFKPGDELKFKKYILQPNRIYAILPNKVYMILTTQKTLFGVDRCSSDLAKMIKEKLRIKFRNPCRCTKFEDIKDHVTDPYEKPPATPYLDQVTKWTSTPRKRKSDKAESKAKIAKLFDKAEEEFYEYLSEDEGKKAKDEGRKEKEEEVVFKRPLLPPPPVFKKPEPVSTVLLHENFLSPVNGAIILNLDEQNWPKDTLSNNTDSVENPQTECLQQNASLQTEVSATNSTTSQMQSEKIESGSTEINHDWDFLKITLNDYHTNVESYNTSFQAEQSETSTTIFQNNPSENGTLGNWNFWTNVNDHQTDVVEYSYNSNLSSQLQAHNIQQASFPQHNAVNDHQTDVVEYSYNSNSNLSLSPSSQLQAHNIQQASFPTQIHKVENDTSTTCIITPITFSDDWDFLMDVESSYNSSAQLETQTVEQNSKTEQDKMWEEFLSFSSSLY